MNAYKYTVMLLLLGLMLSACAPAMGERIADEVQGNRLSPGVLEEPKEMPPMESEGQSITGEEQEKAGENALLTELDTDIDPLSFVSTGSRMVIKDGIIDLLVSDTDRALQQVTQLASDQGGYIISSRSWIEDGFKYAELRLGIPSVAFESTLNILRDLGLKVLNETLSGQDVSAEYSDLQSRLTNLEATAARVRTFLDDAKTVEESLRINQTLSELEGQIEQVKGQMRYYEGRSAYSTVTVTLTPQRPTPTPAPTRTPTPPWNPGDTFQDASKVMVQLFQVATDFIIWVLVLFWPLLLVVAIVLAIFRYRRAKRSAKTPDAEKHTD